MVSEIDYYFAFCSYSIKSKKSVSFNESSNKIPKLNSYYVFVYFYKWSNFQSNLLRINIISAMNKYDLFKHVKITVFM